MNVTFIGGGNMAQAMSRGLLQQGFSADQIRIVETHAATREALSRQFACADAAGAHALIDTDTVIVLAVKPQQMREAVGQLEIAKDANLIISIMAGVKLSTIARARGNYTRLVRAMPNTPALIGAGITGYYAMPGRVSAEDVAQAEKILGAMGRVIRVESEEQLNAVTAVSGSGPAYVFYFMEALRAAALELGLPNKAANQLAIETFRGAALLAAQSSEDVSLLRERVTSKGGTTEAALASMTKDHLKDAIVRAVRAANERGRELGEKMDEK